MIYGKIKKQLKQVALPAAVLALVLVLASSGIFRHVNKPKIFPKPPVATSASQPASIQVIDPGLPLRLKIPSLEIDAKVLYMGLTTAGDMQVPSTLTEVGWYKYSPLPGNRGTAVVAGHLGIRGPGIFSGLKKLQVGDSVQIIDDKGQAIIFAVRKTQIYAQESRPSEVFNSGDGIHLNLITCAGDWDSAHQTFAERLVVFADKSS